ncbi:hypothetical protein [Corynebacterium ulcerans]|uniref:hypothetical protein n=1 Tax=Corynebacterium ulcerans TaxID=65058 RepID=UPI0018D9D9C4|nr:hypothetical protein [Corynebacterium ulcerans]MBH5302342.1 hypothetical protein [Corynebacterium ulcerans]
MKKQPLAPPSSQPRNKRKLNLQHGDLKNSNTCSLLEKLHLGFLSIKRLIYYYFLIFPVGERTQRFSLLRIAQNFRDLD